VTDSVCHRLINCLGYDCLCLYNAISPTVAYMFKCEHSQMAADKD